MSEHCQDWSVSTDCQTVLTCWASSLVGSTARARISHTALSISTCQETHGFGKSVLEPATLGQHHRGDAANSPVWQVWQMKESCRCLLVQIHICLWVCIPLYQSEVHVVHPPRWLGLPLPALKMDHKSLFTSLCCWDCTWLSTFISLKEAVKWGKGEAGR